MAIGIIVTPLFFRYITVAEFGYWTTILDLTNFLNIFSSGISVYLVQTIAKESTSASKSIKTSFSSITAFQYCLALLLLLACFCFYFAFPTFGDPVNQFSNFHFFIGLMGIYLLVNALWVFNGNILYGQNRITLSNSLALVQKLLMQLLPVSFLFFGFNLIAFPLSFVLISLILLLVSTYFSWDYLRSRFSISAIEKKHIGEISLFSYRSILGGASYYVLHFTDTLIIANFLSSSSVTIYVLTMKLANFAKFLPGKVVSMAFPSIAQLVAEQHYERLRSVSKKLFAVGLRIGLFSGAVIFFLNDLFVPNWVGADKFGGNILSYMSAIICFRESIMLVFTNIIYSTKEIRTINYILFFEALSNIVLSIILLRFLDIEGVALATILSSCFLSVGYAWYKASVIIQATAFHFVIPLFLTILRFLPTFGVLWIGRLYLAQYFSWPGFVGLVLASGILNVISFEGATIYKYRKLPIKEIVLKVVNEA